MAPYEDGKGMDSMRTIREYHVEHPRRGCSVCGTTLAPQAVQVNEDDGRLYLWRGCDYCASVVSALLNDDWYDDTYDDSGLSRDTILEYLSDQHHSVYEAMLNGWVDWTPGLVKEALAEDETSVDSDDETDDYWFGDGYCHNDLAEWMRCKAASQDAKSHAEWIGLYLTNPPRHVVNSPYISPGTRLGGWADSMAGWSKAGFIHMRHILGPAWPYDTTSGAVKQGTRP